MVLLVIASHNILFPPPIPPYQVWEVSGQVTDVAGKPIEPLGAKDVTLVPPPLEPNVAGTFKLKFYSWLGPSNEVEFPTLAVSHDDGKVRFESRMIDLNSSSSSDLVITRSGHTIQIKRITLNGISQAYEPSNVTLKQVPYSAESTTVEHPQ